MDRTTAMFVEGMGAAAATSGVLTQLQGRIFGLLYMQEEALSLDDITAELQQSKSNVSVQIRGLVDWQLVRHIHLPGSRRDHYDAVTDFWRVLQEIVQRRFRWNLRQVLATVEETERALASDPSRARRKSGQERLNAIRDYFLCIDALLSALATGEALTSSGMLNVATRLSPGPAPLKRVDVTGGRKRRGR